MRRWARIAGVGAYAPRRVMTNQELETMVETSDTWIRERTGVRERRIAAPEEAVSDLGLVAARAALSQAHLKAEALDLIIVATCTPDVLFPSTACLLQHRLGATRAAAFDLGAACSGFLYALAVGDQYIRTGTARRVLVVGAEAMSRITDWTDRMTCVLFGDGAGAAILTVAHGEARGLLSAHLHADGALWDLLCVPGGGSRRPPSRAVLEHRAQYIQMKGNETFKVAVRALEEAAREALAANHLSVADLDLFIPHQANERIIMAVADRLGLPLAKIVINLDRYGNTSAASIPLALAEAVEQGRLKEGAVVLLAAFGAGLTWASVLLRW